MSRAQWARLAASLGALLLLTASCMCWCATAPQNAPQQPRERFGKVPDDLPVLPSPAQVAEYRLHGGEGLPSEYVDYSARYVRLP